MTQFMYNKQGHTLYGLNHIMSKMVFTNLLVQYLDDCTRPYISLSETMTSLSMISNPNNFVTTGGTFINIYYPDTYIGKHTKHQ